MHPEAEAFLDWFNDKSDSYCLSRRKRDFIVTVFKVGLISHLGVCLHEKNIALFAEKVAQKTNRDTKAAFLGGLLHDAGKFSLPSELFFSGNITAAQYETIKLHAKRSYQMLKDYLLFTSLVAGIHHSLGVRGYGLMLKDFPDELSKETIEKICDIALIVSVADYIEASLVRRDSILLDGTNAPTLRQSLLKKYPGEVMVIEASLECAREMGWTVR